VAKGVESPDGLACIVAVAGVLMLGSLGKLCPPGGIMSEKIRRQLNPQSFIALEISIPYGKLHVVRAPLEGCKPDQAETGGLFPATSTPRIF
jgi:hypothetical protein